MKKKLISIFAVALSAIVFFPALAHADELPTDATSTDPVVTSTPSDPAVAPSATLHIRYHDRFIFEGVVTIPTSTAFNYHDSGSTDIQTTSTAQSSVLALLAAAASATSSFAISDLSYYPNYNSFLLNCLHFDDTDACYSWNYVVNNAYPSVGMGDEFLTGNEQVYVYFSNPWFVNVSSSTIPVGTTTTIATIRYQYDNVDEPTAPDGHDLVSIAVPNPSSTGWWDATTVVGTTTTDDTGHIDYAFNATGTYFIQITALDYSKYSDPVTVTVVDVPPVETPVTPPVNNGSGGGGGAPAPTFDTNAAVQFLANTQGTSGAIGSTYLSDWAAIALGSVNRTSASALALKGYLLTDPSPLVTDSPTTDNARRAMALMALGVNPYNGTPTNYIDRLTSSYDGEQFGSRDLVNDDIFALMVLRSAGYSATDPMIASTTAFIVHAQNPDGSWIGADVTAAAAQALSTVPNNPGVASALSLAQTFLHSRQQNDGSFDHNVFTTAWVMQAIGAMNESVNNWKMNNLSAFDYLRSNQSADGGLLPDESLNNRLWATSYAIAGATEKSWPAILETFPRPTQTQSQNTSPGAQINSVIIPTIATTTEFASSTNAVATTTMIIVTTTENTVIETLATPPTAPAHDIVTPTQPEQITLNKPTAIRLSTIKESTVDSAPSTTPTTPPNTTLSVPGTAVIPVNKTARGVFAGAATLASTMGLYLGWRLLRTLV